MTFSQVCRRASLLLVLMTIFGCDEPPRYDHLDRITTSFFDAHHYVVEHEGLHIGTYSRSASKNHANEYEFRTTLTMPSSDGLTLSTDVVYQFSSQPPYLLNGATRTIGALANDRPYRVEQLYPAGNNRSENRVNTSVNDRFGLLDFFALELELMANLDSVDDELVIQATPFPNTSGSTTWTVFSHSDQSITVSSTSGDLATYSFEHGLPLLDLLIDDTGLSMDRIAFEELDSFDIQPPHVVEDIRIPIDQPIESPRTVSTLTVQFDFEDGELGPWESLLDAQNVLTSSMHPKTPSGEILNWRGEAIDSQTAIRLRSIVSEVIHGIDEPNSVVNALIAYVNRTITYTDWDTLQSVDETLTQKNGDCTEFSQLFTALATTAKLSARTVVGLAYQESSQSFAIHAWNEVLFADGSVRVVDPTWNQTRADATHIEFPRAYQHEIVRTLKKLRIRVLRVDYDTSQNT